MHSAVLTELSSSDQQAIMGLSAERMPSLNLDEWTSDDACYAWCVVHEKAFLPLNETRVDTEGYEAFWRHCQAFGWLPLFISEDVAFCVSAKVFRPQLRREVGKLLRCEVYWAGCREDDFDRSLAALGDPEHRIELPPPVVVPSAWRLETEDKATDPYRNGVIEILNSAYLLGASDVFFDDEGSRISVRFRLSGVAEVFPPIPLRKRGTFLGALKRMAGISANEVYKFHDDRFSVDLPCGSKIEVRAAFAPTVDGETIALRLQDSRKMIRSGLRIPLPEAMLQEFTQALQRKGGMVLLTGPTGSGKTTTLYASLLSLDRADLVIRTIEDPVEICVQGISQTPVGGNTGRTFASALRSFLRLNPDVILVGEIRDEETAGLAIEASLTGHLLLSTLHAMDTVETITRLIDMFQTRDIRGPLATTLNVVVSQRLAPKLCQACKEPRVTTPVEKELYQRFGMQPPAEVFRRHGCPECGTGVRGRVPLFEMLIMNAKLRDLVTADAHFHSARFRQEWMAQGGRPLGKHALELAAQGLITLEEAKSHMVWIPESHS